MSKRDSGKYSKYFSMTFITTSVVIFSASSRAVNGLSKPLEFHTLMIVFHVMYVQIFSTFLVFKSSDLKPNKLINSLFNYLFKYAGLGHSELVGFDIQLSYL